MVSMMSLREGGSRGISLCLSSVRGDHGLDDVPEGGRQQGDQSVSVRGHTAARRQRWPTVVANVGKPQQVTINYPVHCATSTTLRFAHTSISHKTSPVTP